MTEKIKNISQIIRSTEEYSDVCDMCRDEILLYPTISGRTEYTQDEVEQITLKRIIDKLRAKEQECEIQRHKLNYYITKTTQLLDDIDNYKQALDEIRQYRVCEINDEDDEEDDTILRIIDEAQNGGG